MTSDYYVLHPSYCDKNYPQSATTPTQYDEADLNKSQKSRVKIDGFLQGV